MSNKYRINRPVLLFFITSNNIASLRSIASRRKLDSIACPTHPSKPPMPPPPCPAACPFRSRTIRRRPSRSARSLRARHPREQIEGLRAGSRLHHRLARGTVCRATPCWSEDETVALRFVLDHTRDLTDASPNDPARSTATALIAPTSRPCPVHTGPAHYLLAGLPPNAQPHP